MGCVKYQSLDQKLISYCYSSCCPSCSCCGDLFKKA